MTIDVSPGSGTDPIRAMQILPTDAPIQRKAMNDIPPHGEMIYITCTGYKGQPRKSILVCHQCRRGRKCKAFQAYLQPELPFKFKKQRSQSAGRHRL